jgi:hypothetical protein
MGDNEVVRLRESSAIAMLADQVSRSNVALSW